MTAYWQKLGLLYDPFMAEQANQTPYVNAKWEQQLDLLLHLCNNQAKMLLLTGLSGIGKTTLMRQMIHALGANQGICKVYGGSTITPDVIQELLVRHLNLSTLALSLEDFKMEFQNCLQSLRDSHQDFYLLIDNAHKLPKTSLAFLLDIIEWQDLEKHSIHIVLFGGTPLEAMLGDITARHLGEDLTHTLRLEPLSLESTKEYILQRFRLAGLKETVPLTLEQVKNIYDSSQGIPAKINFFTHQILLQKKFQKNSQEEGAPLSSLRWVSFAGTTVVVICAFMIFFSHEIPHKNAVKTSTETLVTADAQENVASLPSEEKAQAYSADDMPLDNQTLAQMDQNALMAQADVTAQAQTQTTAQTPTQTTIGKTAQAKPQIKSNSYLQEPKLAKTLTVKDKSQTQGQKIATQTQSALPAKVTADQNKIAHFSAKDFGIQLSAVSDFNKLQNSLAQTTGQPVYYFHSTVKGKDYYVAVLGHYPSKEKAQQAAAHLPKDRLNNKPWIRSYGDIQQIMG